MAPHDFARFFRFFRGGPPSPPPKPQKPFRSVRTFLIAPRRFFYRLAHKIFSKFCSCQTKFSTRTSSRCKKINFLAVRVYGIFRDLGKSCVPKNRGFLRFAPGLKNGCRQPLCELLRVLRLRCAHDLLFLGGSFFSLGRRPRN